MLAAMFSGRFELEVDKQGRYFIDRDGTYFSYILNYLRDESQLPPAPAALHVYREAHYFRIERLIRQLERYPSIIPHVIIEELKQNSAPKYEYWKHVLLDTVQQKYSQVLQFSLGNDCVLLATRYMSVKDFWATERACEHYSLEEKTEIDANHNLYCMQEGGRLGYFIGSVLPLVDFVIPEEDIPDCRVFTALVEKDMKLQGFYVSGRSSYAWKCSRCDVTGWLYQMAFRLVLPHARRSETGQHNGNVM